LTRRSVVGLITIRCFRSSARKAKNGFVGPRNCFVTPDRTKQNPKKINAFSRMQGKWLNLSFIGLVEIRSLAERGD